MCPDVRANLPNFLICGAAKAGTTSLYHFFRNRSDIFMPTVKEPHFLVRNEVDGRINGVVKSLEEYTNLFQGSGSYSLRGEASVFYLYYYKEAIENILELLGRDIKIIILLRNPIDRAYSAYLHAAKYNHKENLPFEAALRIEEERMQDPACSPMLFYKSVGLYSHMVSAYQDAFPNTKIFFFDDLKSDPLGFSKNLFEFLGLQVSDARSFDERQNVGGREWSHLFVGKTLKMIGSRPVRDLARRLAPDTYELFKSSLAKYMMRPVNYMDDSTREYLKNYFRDDINSLSKMVNRDLTHWIT